MILPRWDFTELQHLILVHSRSWTGYVIVTSLVWSICWHFQEPHWQQRHPPWSHFQACHPHQANVYFYFLNVKCSLDLLYSLITKLVSCTLSSRLPGVSKVLWVALVKGLTMKLVLYFPKFWHHFRIWMFRFQLLGFVELVGLGQESLSQGTI